MKYSIMMWFRGTYESEKLFKTVKDLKMLFSTRRNTCTFQMIFSLSF